MIQLFVTVFYSGYIKPAPGTWGSAVSLGIGILIYALLGVVYFLILTVLICVLGIWAINAMTKGKSNHDPSEIVIDELVGQWIALLPVFLFAPHTLIQNAILCVLAFLAFRVFDILKPGPVGWADKRDDAFGVMFDDVIAGLMAAVLVGITAIWII